MLIISCASIRSFHHPFLSWTVGDVNPCVPTYPCVAMWQQCQRCEGGLVVVCAARRIQDTSFVCPSCSARRLRRSPKEPSEGRWRRTIAMNSCRGSSTNHWGCIQGLHLLGCNNNTCSEGRVDPSRLDSGRQGHATNVEHFCATIPIGRRICATLCGNLLLFHQWTRWCNSSRGTVLCTIQGRCFVPGRSLRFQKSPGALRFRVLPRCQHSLRTRPAGALVL